MKKIIKHSPFLDSRRYDDVCFLGHILCLLDGQISEEEKTKLMERFEKEENKQSPSFDFSNVRIAVREALPDESYEWYRWLNKLNEENEK